MMILLCKLVIKSEETCFSPSSDNEMTTKLSLLSIISFLTEKREILCSDIFKWTSVLQRGHGSNTSHFNLKNLNNRKLNRKGYLRVILQLGMRSLSFPRYTQIAMIKN